MRRKKTILWISAVGLLALLNVIRWAPVLWKGKGVENRGNSGWMRLDFPSPQDPAERKVRRDLFAFGPSAIPDRPKQMAKATPIPAPQSSLALSFPDGSVMEAAGGYRLMGVVSRGGSSQALVGCGNQLFQVGPGDSLGDGYQVQSIGENEVILAEKPAGGTVKLRIWDPTAAIPGAQANNGGMNPNDPD